MRPIDDGLIYHVINRGNNRQDVFHKAGDFTAFLKALAELKERRPFELYGYCLMSNHIHLLIRPRKVSISRIVQSLLVSHTQRYHKHHRSGGHVWQGRFKSPVIQDDEHLLNVLRYIEANPLRAGTVERAEEYPWSSYAVHGLGAASEFIDRLACLDEIASDAKRRQAMWDRRVHQPLAEEQLEAIRRSVNSGLPYGDERWVNRLARRLELDLTTRLRGRPRKTPEAPK